MVRLRDEADGDGRESALLSEIFRDFDLIAGEKRRRRRRHNAARTHIEHIDIWLYQLHDLRHLVRVHAVRLVVLGRDAQQHRLFLRPDLMHRLEDLDEQAAAVFSRTAVGIGTKIGERRKEFAEQIAVRRMDLHCIKACLLGALCRIAEGLYNVFAVALVHFMRRFRVFIERDGARRKNDRLLRLAFSACMVELNRDLRAEAPAFGNERRECVHLLVVPQAETVVRNTAVRHDAGRLNDDESDAAYGAGGVVREMERIWHSVFRAVHAHRRHDHTVAQRHILYLKRGKQLHLDCPFRAVRVLFFLL